MKKLYIIVIILIGYFVLACSGKNETEVREIMDVVGETSVPEPPPPSFSCSNTVTLQEWFFKLCDTENPENDTAAYKFCFFEMDSCYAVYLIGPKNHEEEVHVSAIQNDDEGVLNIIRYQKVSIKIWNGKKC